MVDFNSTMTVVIVAAIIILDTFIVILSDQILSVTVVIFIADIASLIYL